MHRVRLECEVWVRGASSRKFYRHRVVQVDDEPTLLALRQKLGVEAITTLRGVGYRFEA